MSNLLHDDTPTPASIPIVTRGNAFWRNGERFFVKGITYNPQNSNRAGGDRRAPVDALSEDHLPELEKDMAFVRDLGLNSISLYYHDPSKNHSRAMKHLEAKGIYVTIPLFSNLKALLAKPKNASSFKPNSDTWPMYDLQLIKDAFHLVRELSQYSNVLGFVVTGHIINRRHATKMAEVLRACIRDTKAFLHFLQRNRHIPVGVSACDVREFVIPQLRYFSAGAPSERADFFANKCYSWAGPSSFQISGWRNMVEAIAQTTRMPMLMAEYGTNIRIPRVWDEVLCLYSPDMTSVYTGGFVYTLLESGNSYGVVKVNEGGERVQGKDYANLKESFLKVNARSAEEVASGDVKPYEHWEGEFPPCDTTWEATPDIPPFPGGWEEVVREVLAESASPDV
ncbi:hypothetical protein B0A55_00400 [Friedmanniomyces simplex]|uniref:1,3-beta-glucanosyltransferase n=1 Tax=Friedmanniomyces simplex TaxID=329884 RepID=A0A4U0Y451_9PEZI|nr:hypothetical protein B0A55_00400 [Friedmanniomyces simplex]